MNCDLCNQPIEAAKVNGRYTTLDAKPITKVKGRTVHITTCQNREQKEKKATAAPEQDRPGLAEA